jgi:hypothetical protein
LAEGHNLWARLEIQDPELVADFFIVFSRFEYALKQAGYYKHDDARAEANWEEFAKKNHDRFRPKESKLLEAMEYLRTNPPKKQWVNDGKVGFSADRLYGDDKNSDLERLIDTVKGVRNNLFHGGKFPSGVVNEPGRDAKLLKAAMCVLEHACGLDEKVKRFFVG